MSDKADKKDKIGKNSLKLVLGLFIYTLTTLIVCLAFAFWWVTSAFQAPGPLKETKLVKIERGTGLNQIATLLMNEGILDDHYVFIIGTRLLGAQSDLKAGEYKFKAGISAQDVALKLRDHDVFARRVTIREGLTSFEIVRLLNNVKELTGEITDIPPEGSLLPNSYDYQLNETRQSILSRMAKNMQSTIDSLWPKRDQDLPFKTIEDAIILASIIEKETSVADERRKVAGVFINRLKRGIPLQTDPTVIYAITKGEHKNDGKGPLGRRLLRKDLQIESPYNTYKYPGLPPGPIANPGKASIEAALNPAEHDYIFFVADGTGGHAFAKTLREHNQNVAKWRKIRRKKEL